MTSISESVKSLAPAGADKQVENVLKALETADFENFLSDLQTYEMTPENKKTLMVKCIAHFPHDRIVALSKKLSVDQHVFLGVPYDPFGDGNAKSFYIFQEPLNTSGDFYHLLAYVALSLSLGYKVPKLLLTDDILKGQGTETPFTQNKTFLTQLHLEDHLIERKFEPSPRSSSNSRRKVVRSQLKIEKNIGMDQKVVTCILSAEADKMGKVECCRRIRNVLMNQAGVGNSEKGSNPLPPQACSILELIQGSERPVVVLHLRTARDTKEGANPQSDLDSSVVSSLLKYLNKSKFFVVVVHAGSRMLSRMDGYKSIKNELTENNLYEPFSQKEDNAKFSHLCFFLQLFEIASKINHSLKVIGNTSGTTDIISFLGFNVLNVHHFANHVGYYLNYRMLTQLAFMDVISKDSLKRAVEDQVYFENMFDDPPPTVTTLQIDFAQNWKKTMTLLELISNEDGCISINEGASLCCVIGYYDEALTAVNAKRSSLTDEKDLRLLTIPCAESAFRKVTERIGNIIKHNRLEVEVTDLSAKINHEFFSGGINAGNNTMMAMNKVSSQGTYVTNGATYNHQTSFAPFVAPPQFPSPHAVGVGVGVGTGVGVGAPPTGYPSANMYPNTVHGHSGTSTMLGSSAPSPAVPSNVGNSIYDPSALTGSHGRPGNGFHTTSYNNLRWKR